MAHRRASIGGALTRHGEACDAAADVLCLSWLSQPGVPNQRPTSAGFLVNSAASTARPALRWRCNHGCDARALRSAGCAPSARRRAPKCLESGAAARRRQQLLWWRRQHAAPPGAGARPGVAACRAARARVQHPRARPARRRHRQNTQGASALHSLRHACAPRRATTRPSTAGAACAHSARGIGARGQPQAAAIGALLLLPRAC
jgi:hypothetical protein